MNKTIAVVLVIIVVLLGFIIGGVLVLNNRDVNNFKNIDYNNLPIKATVEKPWGYAESDPTNLTLEQGDKIYRDFMNTLKKGDWAALDKMLTSQRKFFYDNPKEFVKFNDEGIAVFKRTYRPANEYYFYPFLLQSPDIDDVIPVSIKKAEPRISGDGDYFYLVDEFSNETTKVSNLPWDNNYEITYKTKDGTKFSGTGEILIVFDKNEWKFQGAFWHINPNIITKEYGDNTQLFTLFDPTTPNLSIKVGETIKWFNHSGLVFVYNSNSDYWSSPYMVNDSFTKTFNTPGIYKYQIIYLDERPSLNGQIVVK